MAVRPQPRVRQEQLAWLLAAASVVVLALLIYVGSRGLRDFDSALVGYAVGTLVAVAGLVYRYVLWVSRPPTWRYFRGGWRSFFSWPTFRRHMVLVPAAWWTDIFAQTFILRRGFTRWLMHMCIFWGVLASLAVTIPLTFGWVRFTLVPEREYRLWVFGIETIKFPLETLLAWTVFHALDVTAVLLLVGVGIALWRRSTDAGLLSSQRFGFDLLPLVLLAAIAVTGLALTASSMLWEGHYYSSISLIHQVVVVGWMLMLPFGKFFHIVERPATIGVRLYQTLNEGAARAGAPTPAEGTCARCGEAFPSPQFVADLKATLEDLGQPYHMGELGALQDYCPTCKRTLRGQAYFQSMGKQFL